MRLTGNKKRAIFTLTSDDIHKAVINYIQSQYRIPNEGGGEITLMEAGIEDNVIASIIVITNMPKHGIKRW